MNFPLSASSFAAVVLLGLSASSYSAAFTTSTVQGIGADWNAAIWNPGPTSPTAGNTYEVLIGGRVRTPAGGGEAQTFTFPGDQLILTGTGFTATTGAAGASAELRFKSNVTENIYNFPGVNGNPGLLLNGGILNNGDERLITVAGSIGTVAGKTSSINPGGGGSTDISAARAFLITGGISGSGGLSLDFGHDFGGPGVIVPALQIDSSNGSFTGDWTINTGWLKGTAVNSLGLGNFTVVGSQTNVGGTVITGATLDFDYDIFNPTKALTLQGTTSKLILDQNLTFGSVSINSTVLGPGIYTFDQLKSQFEFNIVDGGNGTITVVPEPVSTTLLLVGGLGLASMRRRRA